MRGGVGLLGVGVSVLHLTIIIEEPELTKVREGSQRLVGRCDLAAYLLHTCHDLLLAAPIHLLLGLVLLEQTHLQHPRHRLLRPAVQHCPRNASLDLLADLLGRDRPAHSPAVGHLYHHVLLDGSAPHNLQLIPGTYNFSNKAMHRQKVRVDKKHTSIVMQKRSTSPFARQASRSPKPLTPTKNSYSPLRSRQTQTNITKSPRKFSALQYVQKARSPQGIENDFDRHILNLMQGSPQQTNFDQQMSNLVQGYQTAPQPSRFGLRGPFTPENSSMLNVSERSNQPSERTNPGSMLTSKKVFAKAIAEMGSEKKKPSAFMRRASTIDEGRTDGAPVTFKALKEVQFIESFQDTQRNSVFSRKPSTVAPTQPAEPVKEFCIEEDKTAVYQQQPTTTQALINDSFSKAPPQTHFAPINLPEPSPLQQKAKATVKSIYLEQSSDYSNFDALMQALSSNPQQPQSPKQAFHSVRMSGQSVKSDLTMQPHL